MKALIKVGSRCNQACRFCHRGTGPGTDVPRARVEALIDRAAALGHRAVVLSGGEPTLRTELPAWAARAAARGLDFGLVTNGSCLDEGLVRALVQLRLRYAHISLHGGSAAVHDGLTRARSFDRALATLRHLDGKGVEVWVNCVVTRANLGDLRDVVGATAPFEDAGLKYSFVDPRGAAERELELVPPVGEAAARVGEALAHARSLLGAQRRLAHDGFPLCLLPGIEDLRGDLRAHGFATMAEPGDLDLHPIDEGNAFHPGACRPCALRGHCAGLFRNYVALRGEPELRAVTGRRRPSSFEFVREAQLVTSLGRCPVEALGVAPWDRGRHVFVRHGERVARFRTATREYGDEELAEVKFRSEQLYLEPPRRPDASTAHPPELLRLRRSGQCDPCPHSATCTGLHELVRATEVLTETGPSVRSLLESLTGDVLEIGGDEDRRREAAGPAARAGWVRYLAVAANASRAAHLLRAHPWTRPLVASIDALPLAERSVDHVIMLRSWNTLRDPVRATARLLDALRPGGTLTIVDAVAVGIIRARTHAHLEVPVPDEPPRLRNDHALDAHAIVGDGNSLSLLDRRDVTARTSNEWVLRYRRVEDDASVVSSARDG